ncbi:glycoside hydrolase family protein [Hyphomonas johnsonii MHS-2]|uniref:Beta-xylanase n=1 Tax=Hyphomonas johnsonii MHS-2 TaxID=1280950 RepID=A0A059FRP3_9PROT|nr:glycoside hydrolase family protein [Hyphomonas johnsonii MHS-2]
MAGCVNAATTPDGDMPLGPPLRTLASEKGLRFGSAMSSGQLDDAKYREIMLFECGTMVAENEHKWYTIFPDPDTVNFAPADRLATFAGENGLTMRGHTLLWHREMWSPEWVNALEFSSASETADFVEQKISLIVDRYAPAIYAWDVVNEAIDDETGEFRQTSLSAKMGEQLIDHAFHVAKAHAPDATLTYNDFMSWESTSAAHRTGVLRFLERLKARGVPIDGLGLQSHSNYEMPNEFTRARQRDWVAFCDEVVGMGLDIYITEFDVNDTRLKPDIAYRDALIASYTRDYFDLMLAYPQLKEVLVWGMVDDQNWLQTFLPRTDDVEKRPTVYDSDYKAKSMRRALADAFNAAAYRQPMAP